MFSDDLETHVDSKAFGLWFGLSLGMGTIVGDGRQLRLGTGLVRVKECFGKSVGPTSQKYYHIQP